MRKTVSLIMCILLLGFAVIYILSNINPKKPDMKLIEIEELLLEKYDGYISIDTSFEESIGKYKTCVIDINPDIVESINRYKLIDDMRSYVNEYFRNHPDSELIKDRVEIAFFYGSPRKGWESTGSISNYCQGLEEVYGEFVEVTYKYAQIDELILCTNVIQFNLTSRDIEDIRYVIDNVEGIKCVSVGDIEKTSVLREEYPDIWFY